MDNNVENDVGENEGTDLLDISQDPAVLACGNVVPGEEVLDTTLTTFETFDSTFKG